MQRDLSRANRQACRCAARLAAKNNWVEFAGSAAISARSAGLSLPGFAMSMKPSKKISKNDRNPSHHDGALRRNRNAIDSRRFSPKELTLPAAPALARFIAIPFGDRGPRRRHARPQRRCYAVLDRGYRSGWWWGGDCPQRASAVWVETTEAEHLWWHILRDAHDDCTR